MSPLILNVIDPLVPLFVRLDVMGAVGMVSTALIPSLAMIVLATLSCFTAWSWFRLAGPVSNRVRSTVLACALTLGSVATGFGDAFAFAYNPQLTFYYPFRDFLAGWLNFDIWCGQGGARVAYAGTNIPYFLFGNGLRNEVRYVNVDRHRDWLLHDYHRDAVSRGEGIWPNPRPGWDRIRPNYEEWVANLLAERIQLLVVTHVNPAEGKHNVADADGFPIERQWAESHPDRFEPLYGVREREPQIRGLSRFAFQVLALNRVHALARQIFVGAGVIDSRCARMPLAAASDFKKAHIFLRQFPFSSTDPVARRNSY